MLKLRLLGNATLENEHGSVSGRAVQPRRLALLALLALSPRKSLSRDKLLAYLWPESDTEQARHLLSVAVYELRKAMGEATLITARDDVALATNNLQIDVDAFDAAMDAGEYELAVQLHAGPLLDGFHINDAPEFERWVDAQRAHLARRFAEALEKVAHARAEAGDTEGAVTAWRRLAAHDPYSARVVCGLMLALENAGDRAGALQHARTHASVMRDEFGAEPDPEVTTLADRLKTAPREAHIVESKRAPFVSANARTRASGSPLNRAAQLVVVIIVVLGASLLWRTQRGRSTAAQGPISIAVLPFDNLSPGDTTGYFSDGLSEAIISALSRVPSLNVVSRNSSFAFRGNVDPREVGKRLRVGHVLEGTVRMNGNRVLVTAHLISTRDGYEVWSEDYDQVFEMANFISIQQQIAHSAVSELAERFNRTLDQGATTETSTGDVQAFEHFVAGKHFFHRRTVPDLQRSVKLYEQAIARDEDYALAYAGKAEVFVLLGAYDYGALAPKVAYTTARAAADRALEIDPNLAEAHSALANVRFNYDWDFTGAEAAFQRAIQLSPGYATARHWYSLMLQAQKREREAFEQIMRARELDPLSSVTSTGLARHYYYTRKLPNAIQEYKRTIAVDSAFVTAHVGLGLCYAAIGQYEAAIQSYENAARILGMRTPLTSGLMANAHGLAGRLEQAREHVRFVEAVAATRYVPAEYLAVAYIGMGDADAAFAALDKAAANRSSGVVYLDVEPLVDPIRNDPRFAALLQKVGVRRR